MGDPKKPKKKYFPPRHPWIKENIEAERELTREYALQNKKEIYKLDSILKKFKDQAKKLIAAKTKQAEKEKQQLMQRLHKLGLIQPKAALDDVLGLTLKDIMERRLQNLVCKKSLARTQAQSRQFIVHQHIMIKNKKITSPNYLVTKTEEDSITLSPQSKLSNPDHPERNIETKEKLPVRPAPQEAKEKPKAEKTEEKPKKPSSKSEKPPKEGLENLKDSQKGLEKPKASQREEKKEKSTPKKPKETKK